jgi:hypothetical protein
MLCVWMSDIDWPVRVMAPGSDSDDGRAGYDEVIAGECDCTCDGDLCLAIAIRGSVVAPAVIVGSL